MIRVDLSYNLLPLLNRNDGVKITDQIKNIREQLGVELGFVLPSVRIQDNMNLEDNHYSIKIKEIEAGSGKIYSDKYLAMSPNSDPIPFPGEPTTEPAFGLPAKWILAAHKNEAEHKGFTVVDPATVITTHMIELVKENISELLTFADVQKLIDGLNESHRKLVNDMVPSQVSMGTIQRILQNLLDEKISIRDLPTILAWYKKHYSFNGICKIAISTTNYLLICSTWSFNCSNVISGMGKRDCFKHYRRL
jgi:flagellar biosynthesis protein FlhA